MLSHFAARFCLVIFRIIHRLKLLCLHLSVVRPDIKSYKTQQFLENKMANGSREFDIIIFGATGYTGMYVIEELANSAKNSSIKWAVAGRNLEKLKSSLRHVQEYLSGKYYCFRILF